MNNNKSLIVTTVASTIDQFCMSDIDTILKLYSEVHVLANFRSGNNTSEQRIQAFKEELIEKNIVIHDVDLSRSPFNKVNLLQYKKIKKLINNENYTLIHCHTPIAAIITRLAAKKARKKYTKVIYTAHGFHFFKGAPILNWLLYYTPEKLCSRLTDVLVTINEEDYVLAKKNMKAKNIFRIPGVGVDTNKFADVIVDIEQKRVEIGVPTEAVMLLSVGELNKNKNHEVIIRALSKLNNPNTHYCIAGKGNLNDHLKELINELNLGDKVHLLGYRSDIRELCKTADIFCFPSYREGLSVALMEVMSAGLPVICSNIRGNVDLIQDGKGGQLCNATSVDEFTIAIDKLIHNKDMRKQMGEYNKAFVKQFDIKIVQKKMENVYKEILNRNT